jgi:predicted dehydrogenase
MTSIIVVGSGHWGKNLVRSFAQLGVLAGVVEVNPQLRESVKSQYPKISVFDDYSEALKANVSAVVIATPAPTHYSLAMAALQAGKDVFVEKPVTLKAKEATALAHYADEQGRILMVGHLLLYQPAIEWMKAYLAAGKAGKIKHISTHRLNLGKIRTKENVWWSLAPHDISVILDLLDAPVLSNVQASGQTIVQPKIEDQVHVDLQFSSGQTAHIHCSWYWPYKDRKTVVIAERQILVYDEIAQSMTIHEKRFTADLAAVDLGIQSIAIASDEPLKLECEHFIDCIELRKKPISDGWNGVAVVDILEKVQGVLHD